MSDPVITIITNNTNANRTIHWTGEGAVWVGANASVEVPYEVWSKANRKQRVGILADTKDKSITLTAKLLTKDGYVTVDFDPSEMHKQTDAITAPVIPAHKYIEDSVVDDSKHVIRTASVSSSKAADFFGVKGVPVTAPKPSGAQVVGPSTPGIAIVRENTEVKRTELQNAESVQENEEADVEAVQAEDCPVKEEPEVVLPENTTDEGEADTDTTRELFEEAVKAKDWTKALSVLTDKFGKDKVKFTTRVVMSMQSYDAIVKKYKLDE